MAEDSIESESTESAQEDTYVRLGAQIAFGICFPFLLIAVVKFCVWIVFNPFLFFGLWTVALIIGLVTNAVIEFDFQHGYPGHGRMPATSTLRIVTLQVEPTPPTDEADPEQEQQFWDVNEPQPENDVTGLVGQGESQVDQVPPPPSSNKSTRSRPLKLRRSVNISGNDPSVNGVGARPLSPVPEIPEEESSEDFVLSSFPSTAPVLAFTRSISTSDDITKYIVS